MASNIHDQIKADAATAKAQAKQTGPVPYDTFPALKNLIDSATDLISEELPASFEHEGKTYRLMIDIQLARVAIFDNPAAVDSLLVALLRPHHAKPTH